MEVNGNTLLHLNCTYYYDDEGYPCDSLEEARDRSIDKTNISTIRKQNCYMKEWSEMNEWEKDQAEMAAESATCFLEGKPQEFIYVFGASSDNLLFFGYWTEFQKDLNNGTYSIILN